jgi:FixJ family two-component response regulator
MAKRAEIVLDPEEREVLERWVRRPKTSQALAFRCRIVLQAAEGATSKEIALQLGCNPSTVGRCEAASRGAASTVCTTSRGRESHARSVTPTWSACS